MIDSWPLEELGRIGSSVELEIAVERGDGSQGRWTPIWVVCADGNVYVRTWHRRDTGWFGQALRSHRARVRVPGLEAHVTVEDIGAASVDLRASIDAAYHAKYGAGSASMVSPAAAASTLRLDRVRL